VAQGAVQVVGFAAGVLVIRFLSPREYAYYTIATAGLGMMTVLTDGGIGSSVLALGGSVWQDRVRFGLVIATGMRLRRTFSRFALALGLPLMVLLLHRQGGSWIESVLVAASVVPVFLATVSGHLLEAVPRLHQSLRSLQLLQMAAGAGRLILIAVVVPLWPLAMLANLVAAIPQWSANLRLRTMVEQRVDWRGPGTPELAERMMSQVRRTLPSSIYYALSGQLSVWLISLFGKSDSVAAIGALGRPTMALTILSVAFNAVAVPRFARIPAGQPRHVRARYFQSQLAVLLLCIVFLALLAGFSGPVLAVLGPHYAGLDRELVQMGVGISIAVLGGAAYTLGAARGIVAPPALTVPFSILLQIGLIAILPVATVSGVLWVGILSALGQWLVYLAYFEWKYRGGSVSTPA
jgi:O-antigen/teichoic acid export membrane protein